jgi:GNAT superfamily N-acetyltransferase
MDLKCFDDVWDEESWLDWFKEDRVVYIAKIEGKEVGFVACMILSDGIFIEKLGVKPGYRKQGVSRALLSSIELQARLQAWPHVVSITVPETFLSPGQPDDISGWVSKVGFQAKPPLQPDFFYINGDYIDGVPCLLEVD